MRLLLLVFLATAAQARVPLRPTFAEVSLQLDPVLPYQFLRGQTANQLATDEMEQTRAGRGVPDAIRAAQFVPACQSSLSGIFSIYNKITSKLVPVYEDSKMQSGGVWFVPPQGRHYGDERYILQLIQGCMTGSGAADCATWAATRDADDLLSTADVLDLLNLRVEDGKCVVGANFTLPVGGVWDAQIGNQATFRSRMVLPPLTDAQRGALNATQAALGAVGAALCAEGPPPSVAPVFLAHLAFESLAASDAEEHARQLRPYRLAVDPAWSVAERCTLGRKGGAAHAAWVADQSEGNAGQARIHDNDHWSYTVCLGLHDPRLRIRPSCGTVIDECPVLTCLDAAAE